MTSPQHHIKSTHGGADDAQVSTTVQIDTNGITVLRATADTALDLQYFRIETADADQQLSEMQEILAGVAKSGIKTILYNGPESTLVPDELFAEETTKEITGLLHGDLADGRITNDHVERWQLRNVYRITTGLNEYIQKNYPQAELKHFISRWLGCMHKDEGKELIELIIHPSHFLVTLIRDSKLQFVQRFVYESDEDLLFFLLTICREFATDADTIEMKISGFILVDSALYAALAQNFPRLKFWSPEFSIHTESQFPQHFFSPILNLSRCV